MLLISEVIDPLMAENTLLLNSTHKTALFSNDTTDLRYQLPEEWSQKNSEHLHKDAFFLESQEEIVGTDPGIKDIFSNLFTTDLNVMWQNVLQ